MAAVKKRRAPLEKPALGLLEESVALLRRAPATVLAMYYIGALPFVLALLYFWADMSHGAFAHERIIEASLILALLFVWMKCWQSVFCVQLRLIAADAAPDRWSFRRIARMTIIQASLQPLALFARPIALLITLPYVWVFGFFQNALVLGSGDTPSLRSVATKAAGHAKLWPREHHLAHAVLVIFDVIVWLNVVTAMIAFPSLLKSLVGIETPFAQSWSTVINTTFFATSCAATYLCVNPLTHAFYALRCFYGDAVDTAEDLRVEWKRLGALRARAAALLILCLTMGTGLHAELSQANQPHARRDAEQIDRSITEVLQRREYAWRMPRTKDPKSEQGVIGKFIEDALKTIHGWLRPFGRWIQAIIDWITEYLLRHQRSQPTDDGKAWLGKLRWLYYGLIAVTLGLVCVLIWKRWRTRSRREIPVAQSLPVAPDLTQENVTADQLPEDGWIELARTLSQQGEHRLALRALFLAGLAHLGSRNLIAIAKHKSNLDYERDLDRRARAVPGLRATFVEHRSVFERAWYGRHEVQPDTFEHFVANLEKIRAC
jgi:hypothetical protein